MVVNHLSFIGTPQDVEEFRLMCRSFDIILNMVEDFTFKGLTPGVSNSIVGVQTPEIVPTQYTVMFLTDELCPLQWVDAIGNKWPKAFFTLVSDDGAAVELYYKPLGQAINAEPFEYDNFKDSYEEGEEWIDV